MGFFAVLAAPTELNVTHRILRCHLNLWCLPGLFRRSYFWDVGLDIQVGDGAFSTFQLAIPSRTTPRYRDLIGKVQNPAIAQMIFGKPVAVSDGILEYGTTRVSLTRIGSAELEEKESGSSFSLWTLRTDKPIPPGARVYMRFRFEAQSVGRCWQWKRFLASRYGALVDVRFSDVREAWNVKEGDALKGRILPIESLNFFVVAPARYHLTTTSPAVHYIRILEGRSWEEYLERKTAILGTEKLSIYQWRNPPGAITTADPFRVFLDIDQELAFASVTNGVILAAAMLVIVTVGVRLASHIPDTASAGLYQLYELARLHALRVSALGILAVTYFALNISDELLRRIKWIGGVFDWLERVFFRAKSW
jgi:hypothetical protein